MTSAPGRSITESSKPVILNREPASRDPGDHALEVFGLQAARRDRVVGRLPALLEDLDRSTAVAIMDVSEDMADVAPIAVALRGDGVSLRKIAAHLNTEGYVTRKGAQWTAKLVKRLIDRCARVS